LQITFYDGDAPLAERRAQALSIDQSQLEELLGDSGLRELLDETGLNEVEARLQSLNPEYQAKHTDELHDLLLKLGELTSEEVGARSEGSEVAARISDLLHSRRVVSAGISADNAASVFAVRCATYG
jgi:ATP-dependent Lhr-like helicase